jgi:hypothetical protein
MVGRKHPKNLQSGDAALHTGDENQAPHNGLLDIHQHLTTLLKTIRDICHKKYSGTDATTILNLVRMDKDMYLIHQAPNKLLSSLSKFKGAVDLVKSSKGSPWSHPAVTKIVFQDLFLTSDHGQAKSSNSSEY